MGMTSNLIISFLDAVGKADRTIPGTTILSA